MPIISKIGTRSLEVRLIYTAIFVVLGLGALTMLYPFCLMLSGSFKSYTDFYDISPYPRYWTNDAILFQKYCESKYNVRTDLCEQSWRTTVDTWRLIDLPEMTEERQSCLDDFLAWRAEFDMPGQWYTLGHTGGEGKILPANVRLFRNEISIRFNGDIKAFVKETGIYVDSWTMVVTPRDFGPRRRECPAYEGMQIPYRKFKTTRPRQDRIIIDADGAFRSLYLLPKYGDITEYNAQHGTRYSDYQDVLLTSRVPTEGLARADWEQFVRRELNPFFIRLDTNGQLNTLYRDFLRDKYESIEQLNRRHRSDYATFDDISCSAQLPSEKLAQVDWISFITITHTVLRDGKEIERYLIPSERLKVYGPRQSFEAFVATRRGVDLEQVVPLPLPTAAADYHDTLSNSADLRWEFTTRNYKQVLQYILLHGRGVINTIIYCVLTILAALLVNPLAAYALSRYKPPSQYTILLFCMATMSFPAAVVMIPGFLLLKRFPLWSLIAAAVTFCVAMYLISLFARRISQGIRMLICLGIGLLVGFWAVPNLIEKPSISLLNTFAALVLPGVASGYFIFLLKGFFDSLPRELYEAADLDGASEWTKFWQLTMNLSKPILAVIALQAFTMAYSAFMHAVIVIPDREMWTLMVWIYELQNQTHQTVAYAALVIAAIPTFLVFVVCQNIIIRGIVVPTEK